MSFGKTYAKDRDVVEAFLAKMFHAGVAAATPVLEETAKVAVPVLEQAAVTVGAAVEQAAQNGTAHGSDAMIDVGLAALRAQAPTLGATIGTALVANVVQAAKEAASQAATAAPAPSV